jgi:transposase
MPKLNPLRPLTIPEQEELERIAHSRTEAIRRVERARIILALANGIKAGAVAEQMKVCEASVHNRRKRFNEAGLAGLDDLPRQGRPESYSETQRGEIVLAAKTHPEQLGMSCGHWTLKRLVEYVHG